MDQTKFSKLLFFLCFSSGNLFAIQKREFIKSPAITPTEGSATCFPEYMETWIHGGRGEELEAWLSETLQIQVSLASLDQLNPHLSACGFSLHKDSKKNFLFRAAYSGCSVERQNGYHALALNLKKRTSRFGGRFLMKCPVVSVLPCREQVQCDPEFVQVTREVPPVTWGDEPQWFLSLGEHFIVALEDASLIQMNAIVSGTTISVQGRRKEVSTPVHVWGKAGELLALKLVSGQYAYSMEAICPTVTTSMKEDTVLHIPKRQMGLTKRGSQDPEALTVSSVLVNQTDRFTVQETGNFVTLTIPTTQILQTKACAYATRLLQPFYRVDVVLSFKETNHKMQWSIENTLPCTVRPALLHGATSSPGPPAVPQLSLNPGATEQSHSLSTDQEGAEEEMATETPRTRTENSTAGHHADDAPAGPAANASVVFGGDDTASINVTERTTLDLLNATVNAQTASFEPPTAARPSESSAEPQYQQFTTSSGDKEHQEQLKFIW